MQRATETAQSVTALRREDKIMSTPTSTTSTTRKPTSRDRARQADAAKLAGTPVPADPAQLRIVRSEPAAPAKATRTRAVKQQPAAKPKPAPKPAKPSIDKTAVVHSAMIRAWADLAASWDASTGVSAADALKIIAHRAAYCSPKATWDSRLPARHIHNSH